MKRKSVLVVCAHSDDEIFGPGGTIAKYAKEGIDVHTVIFSYGEGSHPQLQRKVVSSIRQKEAFAADKVIGGRGVLFLGLNEGKFKQEFKEKGADIKLKKIIEKLQPEKIFTHSRDDPLSDHRQVRKLFLQVYDGMNCDADVYTFNIWNVFNIRKEYLPRLVVDISDTFKTKLEALRCFRSQKVTMLFLGWSVYAKAFFSALNTDFKFVEVFYKIR